MTEKATSDSVVKHYEKNKMLWRRLKNNTLYSEKNGNFLDTERF